MHDDERYLFEALKAGASGYVLKREADQDLVGAVRAIAPRRAVPDQRGRALADPAVDGRRRQRPAEPLTPREEEVVKLIAEAHTNAQIAEILHLSEKTVESHRANVLRKLGMRDRVELVRYAIRRGPGRAVGRFGAACGGVRGATRPRRTGSHGLAAAARSASGLA